MFNQSIVIAKCPHFDFGIDGNHASCARHTPFTVDNPDCSKCDVYKELAGLKVVE